MTKKLHISKTLSLPITFVTSTQAILGQKRGGKSYKASVQAEELLELGEQVVVLDPTGAWWGLRSSADGKAFGYPITIFGGDHADVELEATSGAVLAEAIVADRFSAIIDLTRFTKGEEMRFAAAFLETLYRKNREAMHLFLDEADVFAPQKPFGVEESKTLGACQSLVRRGGIRGIGITMITQRPAVLNKDVLSQVDTLTLLRMSHPKDLDAIQMWVAVHADAALAKQMVVSLPSLEKGDAWVWSPASDIFERVTFRDRRTFDSGRTPKAGEKRSVPKVLAPIDLTRLGKTIAETVEQAKANDPEALKARVVELDRQLAAKPAVAKTETKVVEVKVPVLTEAEIKRLETVAASFEAVAGTLYDELENVGMVVKDIEAAIHLSKQLQPRPAPAIARAIVHRDIKPSNMPDGDALKIGGGLERILVALAQHPDGLTDRQVGMFAGLSSKGGTYSTYVSRARGAGYLRDLARGERQITAEGLAALGDFDPLPTGADLFRYWLREIGGGEARILQVLHDAGRGAELTSAVIAERAGISAASGTFSTYISRLRTRELIVGERGVFAASEELFS